MSKTRKYWREKDEDHNSRTLFLQEEVEEGYDLGKGDRIEVMVRSPEVSKNVRSITKKEYRVTRIAQYRDIGEVDIYLEEISEDMDSKTTEGDTAD